MKQLMFTLLIFFCSLLGETAAAPSIVGSLDIPWASGVYVFGSHAYVAGLGIQKVDISNPQNPTIVDSTGETVFSTEDIYISGTYAYVAADIAGLLIMDISDFRNPKLVGSVETPIRARSVYISGHYAYLATWGDTDLYIVDISNPQQPALAISVDFSEPTWAYGVCVSGHRAYLAGGTGGLHVLDVTNPLSPTYAGSVVNKGISDPGPFTSDSLWADGVFVSGSYAYVADIGGLQVIDITDFQNPILAGSVDIQGGASDVYVSGTYAYVTADPFEGKLYLIDVSEFAGGSAAPVDPSVRISLNKSQYAPGDNMKVTLTTSPGTGDNSWDIYVGLILPDSSLYFVTFEPSFSFSPDLVSARPSKPITAESITILDITLPEGLSPGNWQWASVLGKDNLSKISEISSAPFTLNNPQGSELDLTGTWSVQETITGNCPDEDYPYTNTYMAAFVQTGNHLTFTSTSTGTSLSGTISGNSITLTGTRPSEDGTISINFPGTVSSDGNTVTGTATWTWTDGSYTCSGRGTVMMARVAQSTTVNVSGTWQGSWQSSAHNINGTFSTNITQQGSVLSGTINVPEISMSGADLKGTVNGDIITFGDIDEKITFTGTVSGESAASGTYIYPSLTDNGAWQGNKI
ncbi:MAG: LVIVD repeat-containing protein [Dissulfuribacterales bacterium]